MAGLRQRKKERTRREFEEAAMRLFRDQGYEETTVEDIAEVVGVSARTFFRYYAGKEAVLFGPWRTMLGEIVRLYAARPRDESLLASARAVCVLIAQTMEADEAHQRFVKNIVAGSATAGDYERSVMLPAFESALVEATARRLDVDADADLRPALAASVSIATMHAAKMRWVAREGSSLVALTHEAFDALEGLLRKG